MKDTPLLLAASLLLASFVLGNFAEIYVLPVEQADLMEWIAWIFGIGGIVLFLSSIIAHRKRG